MRCHFGWKDFEVIPRLRFAFIALSLCLIATIDTTAFGQLRTGSGNRSLYRNANAENRSRAPGEAFNDIETRVADVVTASHHATIDDDTIHEYASGGAIEGELANYVDSSCDAGLDCYEVSYCFGDGPLARLLRRLRVRAEVPLYWRKGHNTPPLVTTAPTGTAANVAGRLGQGTTQILQSGDFGQDVKAGFRLTLSTYLDPCDNYGVLFRYWNAGDRSDRNDYNSNDFPILARPFRNTTNNAAPINDTQLIAFPGDTIGSISVIGRSQVYGLDVNFKKLLYGDRFTRVDWIYGYQHTSIGEWLDIASNTTVIGNLSPLQGTTIAVTDRFQTQNRFNGTTFGLMSTRRIACFQLETLFRLGLGNLQREAHIRGSTTTTSGGTSTTDNEGLLARSTNTRSITNDTFVLTPEVGINLAYAITPLIDFTVGYNYTMIPKVYQAGELIDPALKVNLSDPLTGNLDPALQLAETRYWVRTLGLGLQIRY